jgi:hypothetical protein
MGKVTYEFDLREDLDDLKIFQHGDEMYGALWQIYNLCRSQMKHGEDIPPELEHVLEEIKDLSAVVVDF